MKNLPKATSTYILIGLVLLLVFQSKNLWLSFDTKSEDQVKIGDVDEFLQEILTPQRLIANFGERPLHDYKLGLLLEDDGRKYF